MIKKLVFLFCVFVLPVFISAKPYQISEPLKAELRQNYQRLQAYPDSNEAKFELAMSYAYTGQIKKGWDILKSLDPAYSKVVITKYQALIDKNPNEWKYHFKIAFGYFFDKEKTRAIESFRKVLTIKPDQVWAYGFIALIKGEMGQVDEAIRICKQALKMEPKATAIRFLLAEGYRKKGR